VKNTDCEGHHCIIVLLLLLLLLLVIVEVPGSFLKPKVWILQFRAHYLQDRVISR